MISVTARRCLLTIAGVAAAISLVGNGAAQDELRRNAIFNGDFLEGRAGWVIGGPDDLEVRTYRTMVADRADAELSLRHPGLEQTLGVYSQYPIGVEPGREYTLSLTAAGEGTIAFGVYEYNEAGRNTIFRFRSPLHFAPSPKRIHSPTLPLTSPTRFGRVSRSSAARLCRMSPRHSLPAGPRARIMCGSSGLS